MKAYPFVLVLPLLLSACAGVPPELHRGWVGGEFMEVTSDPFALDWRAKAALGNPILGMPEGSESEHGLLLADAHLGTPLDRAGLEEGDLVLTAGGEPVRDALEFRERVESLQPGSALPLTIWRAGTVYPVDVTVGTETYQREGEFRIFIGLPLLQGSFDLWPFDDGINILNLIEFSYHDTRYERAGVLRDHLRAIGNDTGPAMPHQEVSRFAIMPIGIGKHTIVLRQEAFEE